jgi:uncharacterized protein YkwD
MPAPPEEVEMIRSVFSCLMLILFASPAALHAADRGKEKEKKAPKMSADETKLFELINKIREEHKLPPLRLQPILVKVARGHSDNMARKGKMDHILDGKNPAQRLQGAGYDYRYMGENIAISDGAPLADIVKGWMNSKHHKENILSKRFRETGLAIASSKSGDLYYTQVFGTPQD